MIYRTGIYSIWWYLCTKYVGRWQALLFLKDRISMDSNELFSKDDNDGEDEEDMIKKWIFGSG